MAVRKKAKKVTKKKAKKRKKTPEQQAKARKAVREIQQRRRAAERAARIARGDIPKRTKNQFQPGVSGNSKGRPPIDPDVKEAAKAYTVEAIETLARAMRNKKSANVRVLAANSLLDRGHGKPTQHVEASGPGGGPLSVQNVDAKLKNLSDEELDGLINTIGQLIDDAAASD